MRVRVIESFYYDYSFCFAVEYKKWWHLNWKHYKNYQLKSTATEAAKRLKHPEITEIV